MTRNERRQKLRREVLPAVAEMLRRVKTEQEPFASTEVRFHDADAMLVLRMELVKVI